MPWCSDQNSPTPYGVTATPPDSDYTVCVQSGGDGHFCMKTLRPMMKPAVLTAGSKRPSNVTWDTRGSPRHLDLFAQRPFPSTRR
jgi:hypothetical protein